MLLPGKHPSTGYCSRYLDSHIIFFVLLLIFNLGVVGCDTSSRKVKSFQGSTMGTTYSIKYVQVKFFRGTGGIKKTVDAKLAKINSMMSTWDPKSDLSRINQAPADQWLELHPGLSKLIGFAFDLSEKTDGKYDVSCGPLINIWGFGPKGNKKIPTQLQIKKAMQISGYEKIDLNIKEDKLKKIFKDSYIDLSSIAKGYGVDEVAQVLENFGIKNYMVEIGGEIKTSGEKLDLPWKIAIESPRKDEKKIFNKILNLTDCVMATSGDYRNFFKSGTIRYSHTIDPATGSPVQNDLAGVTVAMPQGECYKADAWATALMASGKDKGMELAAQFKIPAHFIYIEEGRLKEASTKLFVKFFNGELR